MKKLLPLVAVAETATGLALLVVPAPVVWLLFGADVTGVAVPASRVTGIALIALGVACWPGPAIAGMFTYSLLVTLYLAYIGLAGGFTGLALWPAVGLHAILTALLVASLKTRSDKSDE